MMKVLTQLLPCLLVWLCLAACRPKTYPPLLLAADSLTSVLPDSACALLAAFAVDTAHQPRHIRMYHRLLCVKANDKAYIPHTSDSVILPVVAYYERHKDLSRLPEAYYYAGRVYADLGDAPQALDYFQQALEVIPKNENTAIKKLVCSQMGTLFKKQSLYPEALAAYRQSLQCKLSLKDSIGMIYSYRDIGQIFYFLEQGDSALHYYRQAYRLSHLLNKKDLGYGIQALLADFYINGQNYKAAHQSLQIALLDISKYNRSTIYNTAANYYYSVGLMDSAAWYMQQLQDCGDLYTKEKSARGLAEITLSKGETMSAAKHLYQALLLGDSIQEQIRTDEVYRTHLYYNHQLRSQENQRLKLQNIHQQQTNAVIITTFILLSCGGILYYLHQRKVMLLRLHVAKQLQEEAYRNSLQYQKDTRQRILFLEEQLQSTSHQLTDNEIRFRKLEEEKNLLAHTLQSLESVQSRRKPMEQSFASSDICQLFREKEQTNSRITEEDWLLLESEADRQLDGITTKLRRQGKINKQELRASLLIRANFSIKSIAAFICLSPTAVTSIRRRLSIKFSLPQPTPQAWDDFIRSL